MNPFLFAKRRPVTTLILVVALVFGGAIGLHEMHVDVPPLNNPKVSAQLDEIVAKSKQAKVYLVGQYEAYFHKHEEEVHHEEHKIVVTSPQAKAITLTRQYVCQIRSQKHIDVCALDSGYLETISVKEGQAVKKGDPMFKIVPILYKAELATVIAERDVAAMELKYTQDLAAKQGVSPKEVALYMAKLAKAQAQVDLAQAKMDFTTVKAPFDGIVDRLAQREGSLIKEGEMLTTLSDNSVMWVYFNVPEKTYLEYMAETGQNKQSPDIELMLADHHKFPHIGKIGAIEAKFNNETGNIPFRADFPNPERLLRHGQTGTVLLKRTLNNALVIPQRAVFENLAKRYVFIVDKDHVVHQREIVPQHEMDDIYVVDKGLDVNDKIILEGIRQVRDGEKVEYELRPPQEVLADQKNHAE